MARKDSVMIALRVTPELAAKIDARREDRSRAQWCRRVVERSFGSKVNDAPSRTGASGPTAPPRRPAGSGKRAGVEPIGQRGQS